MPSRKRIAQRPAAHDDTTKYRVCDIEFLRTRAIDPEVARERGYRATGGADLRELGFSKTQAALGPGLLIPIHDVDGATAYYQLRPDVPRLTDDGKPGPKYECPAGQHMILDCHPRIRHQLGDPDIPLLVCESAPKADSCISAGYYAVAINGVWGWRGTNADGGKTALPDFESIALNGRTVVLTFDSDAFTNAHVADATERLGAWLARKASVFITRIPAAPDGSKVGIDDFIATGGDLDQLIAEAVPLGRFVDERPRRPEPDGDGDVDYWKSRALAAEGRHREFMHALRCADPSVRKAVPTLAALHYAYDSAVSRDANADPRILRSLAEDGSMRVTRRTLAEISGRSEATITTDLQLLEVHGCVTRNVTRLFPGDVDPDSGEVIDAPKSILRVLPARTAAANFRYVAAVPKPDAEKQERSWGGRRLACPACGSERLEVTCLDCGHRHVIAAPAHEAHAEILKTHLALSGFDGGAVEGVPVPAPHTIKEGILHFQDSGAVFDEAESEKTHLALLDRRRALRETRPRHRHVRPEAPRYGIDHVSRDAIRPETPVPEASAPDTDVQRLCDLCRRPLRNNAERAAGHHSYACTEPVTTSGPASHGPLFSLERRP